MSTLVENAAKVTAAHAALKEAIAAKGVAVPEGTRLSEMPALVAQINTSAETNYPRASFSGGSEKVIVVPKVLVVDLTSTTNLNSCFYACYSLTSLTLPDGFGQAATHLINCFYGCRSLTSLTLPSGFGQAATDLSGCFGVCSSLVSLTLPSGFGQAAKNLSGCFSGCSSLVSLTLPSGFGRKENANITSCFYNCASLAELTLPDGFGQGSTDFYKCFSGCSSLATISGSPKFKVSLDLSSCTQLRHDSLMVVINGLQTVTTAQTLTLGTTNLVKLTDEEKKVATDKGWTLA